MNRPLPQPARVALLACAITLVASIACSGSFDRSTRPRIVNGVPTQSQPTTGALLMNVGGTLAGVCSGTMVGTSPVAGTWYARVVPVSGGTDPFQLTITTFGP